MEINKYLKDKAVLINQELEKFFPRKIDSRWIETTLGRPEFSVNEETANNAVTKVIWDFLNRGGKRWRPALMLLCCEAVGGNPDAIKEFVVLPELAHNGTIMVDDVEDNSILRRGKPCTHKIFGIDLAINDGNLMYYLPLTLLFKNTKGLSNEKRVKIYDIYSREMLKLSFGQAFDIYWHQGKGKGVREEDYLQMAIYKTGALARLSAEVGVVLGDGNKEQLDRLGSFAATIGVAFQIQDDVLNLIPSKKWGKELGEDIKEGKRSLLVLHALRNSDKKDKDRLLQILNSENKTKKTVDEAIEIIKKYKSIEYAKEKAKTLVVNAWKDADAVLEESDAKKGLKAFADYVINRKL